MSVTRKISPENCRSHDAVHYLYHLTSGSMLAAFRTVDHENRDGALAKTYYGNYLDLSETLVDLNTRGADIYAVLQQTESADCGDQDVKAVRAFHIGVEGRELESIERQCPIAPRLVMEISPGRYNLLWFLDPILPVGTNSYVSRLYEMTQYQLSIRFNSNPSVVNLAGLVRMPGFFNWTSPEPFRVRWWTINAPAIHPREFMKAFSIDLSVSAKTSSDVARATAATAMELGARYAAQCSRNPRLGRHTKARELGLECRRQGLSEPHARYAAGIFHSLLRPTNSYGEYDPVELRAVERTVVQAYGDGE